MERIVAAAILFEGIVCALPPPARHRDLIKAINSVQPNYLIGPDEQGFVTDTGRWVDRSEARDIAVAASQYLAPEKAGWSKHLFSEDVW